LGIADGTFVFGFEHGTMDKIDQLTELAIKSRLSMVQFLFLTSLPGTVTFQ